MNNALAFLNLGTGEIRMLLGCFLLIITFMILWIFCLVDIIKSKMDGVPMAISLLLIFCLPLLGCIIYLISRNKLKQQTAAD